MSARPPGTPYRLRAMADAFGTAAANVRSRATDLESSSAGSPATWGWSGRAAGTYRRTWQDWKTVADGLAYAMDSARGARQILHQLADHLQAAQRAWDDAASMAQGMGLAIDANGYVTPRSVPAPAAPAPGSPEEQIESLLGNAAGVAQRAFEWARDEFTWIFADGWYESLDRVNTLAGYPTVPATLLTSPGTVRAGAQYFQSARNFPRVAAQVFGDEVGPAGRAFDAGTATYDDLAAAARLGWDRVGIARALTVLNDRAGFLGEGSGLVDGLGKVLLPVGAVGDVLTLINPGHGSATEQGLNRGAAFVNLTGTVAVGAGMAADAGLLGTAGGLLAADAALGWVPVAGQVLLVGSGLVLAGIWAYDNVPVFHDFCNSVGSETAHIATAAWNSEVNMVSNDVHAVTAAAHTVQNAWNSASHAVSSFFHWP